MTRTGRRLTDEHLVHDDPQGPPVAQLVVAGLHEDLGSDVVGRSHRGIGLRGHQVSAGAVTVAQLPWTGALLEGTSDLNTKAVPAASGSSSRFPLSSWSSYSGTLRGARR